MGALVPSDYEIFLQRYSFAVLKKFISERSEIFKYVAVRKSLYGDLNPNSALYGITEPVIQLLRSTFNLDYGKIFQIVQEARRHLIDHRIVSNAVIPLITQNLLKLETDIALGGKCFQADKVYDVKKVSADIAFHVYGVRLSGREYGSALDFEECLLQVIKSDDPSEILTEVGYVKSLSLRKEHDKSLVEWQQQVRSWERQSGQAVDGNAKRNKRHTFKTDPNFWSTAERPAYKRKNVEVIQVVIYCLMAISRKNADFFFPILHNFADIPETT